MSSSDIVFRTAEVDDKPTFISLDKKAQHPSSLKQTSAWSKDKKLRVAAIAPGKPGELIPTNPYAANLLNMMEDSVLNDPTIQRALKYLITFTLGSQINAVLQARDDTLSDEEKKIIINKPEHQNNLRIIKNIDRRSKLFEKLYPLMEQAYVFGRSALAIDKGPITILGQEIKSAPIRLKPLSTRNLGEVVIDRDTWDIKGVMYNDVTIISKITSPVNRIQIRAEDMLYLTHEDTNTKPDSIGYGRSRIQSSIHASEINRIATERDIKEIIYSLWAGMFAIKVNTKNASVISSIVDNFEPGVPFVHNQDFTVQEIKIEHDLDKILETIDQMSMRITQGIGVPRALMGWEDVQNKATLEGTLQAWEESTLTSERAWLKRAIESQWYDQILKQLYGVDDPEAIEVKVSLEFESITFSSWLDKIDGTIQLKDAGLITDKRALQILDLGEGVEEELQEAQGEAQELRGQQADMQKDILASRLMNSQGEDVKK